MTKKIKDLAVKVGTYEKGGETKNRYLNIGCILEKDDGGKFMLLDPTFNTAGVDRNGRDTIMVSMFDVKGGEEKSSSQSAQKNAPASNAMDDEIPF